MPISFGKALNIVATDRHWTDPSDEKPMAHVNRITLPRVQWLAETPDPTLYDKASFRLDAWRKESGLPPAKRWDHEAEVEEEDGAPLSRPVVVRRKKSPSRS